MRLGKMRAVGTPLNRYYVGETADVDFRAQPH